MHRSPRQRCHVSLFDCLNSCRQKRQNFCCRPGSDTNLMSPVCSISQGSEVALAKAAALLTLARARAFSASKILVYVVLRYGVQAARKMAEMLSRSAHRALLRLQLAYHCLQRPQEIQHQVGACRELAKARPLHTTCVNYRCFWTSR